MYSQKWNCAALFPILTFMYLWAIYIFPGSHCLLRWHRMGRPILGIYKSPQIHKCGNWETEHHNSVLEITRRRSFVSGNTLFVTRQSYWIHTSPLFALHNKPSPWSLLFGLPWSSKSCWSACSSVFSLSFSSVTRIPTHHLYISIGTERSEICQFRKLYSHQKALIKYENLNYFHLVFVFSVSIFFSPFGAIGLIWAQFQIFQYF